jgi:hypothetical protein
MGKKKVGIVLFTYVLEFKSEIYIRGYSTLIEREIKTLSSQLQNRIDN